MEMIFPVGQSPDLRIGHSVNHLFSALLFLFSELDYLDFANDVPEHIIEKIDAAVAAAKRILESLRIVDLSSPAAAILKVSNEELQISIGTVC